MFVKRTAKAVSRDFGRDKWQVRIIAVNVRWAEVAGSATMTWSKASSGNGCPCVISGGGETLTIEAIPDQPP